MGKDPSILSQWRTNRTFPIDADIIKLGQVAGIGAAEALVLNGMWRNRDKPDVVTAYRHIFEVVKTTAAALLFFGILSFSSPSDAAQSVNNAPLTPSKIYIMRHLALGIRT